jgi:hypothetical protein
MLCRPGSSWPGVAPSQLRRVLLRTLSIDGAEADLALIDASESGSLCEHSVGGFAWPAYPADVGLPAGLLGRRRTTSRGIGGIMRAVVWKSANTVSVEQVEDVELAWPSRASS